MISIFDKAEIIKSDVYSTGQNSSILRDPSVLSHNVQQYLYVNFRLVGRDKMIKRGVTGRLKLIQTTIFIFSHPYVMYKIGHTKVSKCN